MKNNNQISEWTHQKNSLKKYNDYLLKNKNQLLILEKINRKKLNSENIKLNAKINFCNAFNFEFDTEFIIIESKINFVF